MKHKIADKLGTPPRLMLRLVYAGRELLDNRSTADYNITMGSIIHVFLPLLGGSRYRGESRHLEVAHGAKNIN